MIMAMTFGELLGFLKTVGIEHEINYAYTGVILHSKAPTDLRSKDTTLDTQK